jgi:cysteine synthase A
MKDSILEAIGSPLVRVPAPEGATIAAKLEAFNPGGSAKDRPAREMVLAAEQAGHVAPGDRLVEATSGNTGIGLALVAAARGYDLTIAMPASMSQERRNLLRAYGADLELVDGGMETANDRADELAAANEGYRVAQFENPANPRSHYRTTAEEIIEQVEGRDVDALVAGVGTGGTITGTATRLLEEYPDMDVVAVEPESNAVLATGEAGNDEYQGMGPGFVSDLLDRDLIDRVETVALNDAEAEVRRLAGEEGILVGQSSGAAYHAAQRVAEGIAEPELDCPEVDFDADEFAEAGLDVEGLDESEDTAVTDGGDEYDDCPLVVTVFPDSGERYLSAGVFEQP